MGYTVDSKTVLKNTNKRNTFVYMSRNIRSGVGLNLWRGVLEKTRETDANLICYIAGNFSENNSSQIFNLINMDKVDGIISETETISDIQPSYYDQFKGYPFITLSVPVPGFPVVMADSYHSMKNIVEHLIKEHLHTKIAFVRGPENHIYSLQRYKAYIDVVKENNIYNKNLITPPLSFEPEAGVEGIRILLDERKLQVQKDIEAIVFVSDTPAIAGFTELTRRNIKIPDQLAVTGFNASPEARCTAFPITTVEMPFAKQAGKAVELLKSMLNKEEIPMVTTLPAKLLVAQSCGCQSQIIENAAVKTNGNIEDNKNRRISKKTVSDSIMKEIKKYTKMMETHGTVVTEYSGILLKAFFDEIENNKQGEFLHQLNIFIDKLMQIEKVTDFLQNLISILRRNLFIYTENTDLHYTAENLWNQSRILISEVSSRKNDNQCLARIMQEQTMREISEKLLTTYNMNTLLNVLAENLSRLNIPGCYISLFEDTAIIESIFNPPEKAKLIFAFENGMRRDLNTEGIIYNSKDLLPTGYSKSRKQRFLVVQSLTFNTLQIGFVVFEPGPEEGFLYYTLRNVISSAMENKYTDYLKITGKKEKEIRQNKVKSIIIESYKPDSCIEQASNARYFYSNMIPDNIDHDFVLYGGLEECNPENLINRISNDYYCLELVIEGKGEIKIGNKTHSLYPGVAYIFGPSITHVLKTNRSNPLHKYFIVFQGTKLLKFLKDNEYSIGDVIQLNNLNEIIELIEILFKESLSKKPFYDSICTELLYLIILKILESRASENLFVSIYSERFQMCKSYIDKNYLKIHTMDDIVRDLNLQKTYICRLFKMFGYESPYKYLLRKKLNHAMNMLLNTNIIVRIIAHEVGFDDPYHFSKVFKKMFMMSPKKFRQIRQKENHKNRMPHSKNGREDTR